jgi:hypothetical protein
MVIISADIFIYEKLIVVTKGKIYKNILLYMVYFYTITFGRNYKNNEHL